MRQRLISCIFSLGLLCFSGLYSFCYAQELSLVGLFPGKAVIVVNGGSPKTYAVGASITSGIKLAAVHENSITIDDQGKRRTLAIGGHVSRAAPSGLVTVTLPADGGGHFFTQAQINGGTLRVLVDTGATLIALSAADAKRLGIAYQQGRRGTASTANGTVPVYQVTLDTVKIGDIELNQVDAMVQESGLPITLLGMSFLRRVEMRNEGDRLTLTKKY